MTYLLRSLLTIGGVISAEVLMVCVQEFVNSFSGMRETCFVIIYYLSKHVNHDQVMRQTGTNHYSAFIYAHIYRAAIDDEP